MCPAMVTKAFKLAGHIVNQRRLPSCPVQQGLHLQHDYFGDYSYLAVCHRHLPDSEGAADQAVPAQHGTAWHSTAQHGTASQGFAQTGRQNSGRHVCCKSRLCPTTCMTQLRHAFQSIGLIASIGCVLFPKCRTGRYWHVLTNDQRRRAISLCEQRSGAYILQQHPGHAPPVTQSLVQQTEDVAHQA